MSLSAQPLQETFDGKVALVTGAGSGIGRAVAIALSNLGANVVVADISPKGKETVELISAAGKSAQFVAVDLSDSAAVATLFQHVITQFGRLDIAINNAGIDPEVKPEPVWEDALFDRIFSVNVKAMFLCMKHELAHMLEHGGGRIVNIASAAGLTGVANKPLYTASKHAVIGMTRASALQYASRGVRINAVCPGAVDTPMLEDNLAGSVDKAVVGANHPIGRLASPEEIARAIVWLCSDGASYVIGHALTVDGGLTVQ